ncbi:MAG: Fic family protein [Patescibacteria group bacterium]|jgi:Fic family protein
MEFKPQYQLSPELLVNLNQIERFYGQLESLHLPKTAQLNLERDNLFSSSYISNSIEGNPLSLPEVTNLLLGDRVPTNRDEKEVCNYFDILKNLHTKVDQPLTVQYLLSLHQQLLHGVKDDIAGQIRNQRIVVGHYQRQAGMKKLVVKHEPPSHKQTDIQKSLQCLFHWIAAQPKIPAVVQVGIFHHQFVYIHPFVDGNGRSCRLLTAWLLLKYGYRINKYFVLDDWYDIDRTQYSDKLHTADSGDKTEWLEYFTDGMKYSLQTALAKAQYSIESVEVPKRLSKQQRQVYELLLEQKQLTSQDIVHSLKISRQLAHRVLKALVGKGFAAEKGVTKGKYYILK